MKCEPFSPLQADAGPLASSLWLQPRLAAMSRDESLQADVCRSGGALLGRARDRISSTGERG